VLVDGNEVVWTMMYHLYPVYMQLAVGLKQYVPQLLPALETLKSSVCIFKPITEGHTDVFLTFKTSFSTTFILV